MTRQALLNQLAVLLGGRSAEEIAFQEISTGAQNDLQRATDLARAMVAEYGMSEALGPVAFKGRNRQRFLEGPGLEAEPFAEETARQVDSEIKQLVVDAHTRASNILRDRRSILGKLARRLIEQEVVEGAEVRALVTQVSSSDPERSMGAIARAAQKDLVSISALNRAEKPATGRRLP